MNSVSQHNPTNIPANETSSEEISQTISVPRWVVYFQAALLGIVATTFFVFGLMVGSLTSGGPTGTVSKFDCQVSGIVQFDTDDSRAPDAGAVVFLLPKNSRPEERSPGNLVSPDGFEPLDNPGIELVNQLGGAVVRADENGRFNVVIDASQSGIDYFLLVVSKNVGTNNPQPLTKLQVATIGTFYLPVERVMNDRTIYWSTLKARSENIELPPVTF